MTRITNTYGRSRARQFSILRAGISFLKTRGLAQVYRSRRESFNHHSCKIRSRSTVTVCDGRVGWSPKTGNVFRRHVVWRPGAVRPNARRLGPIGSRSVGAARRSAGAARRAGPTRDCAARIEGSLTNCNRDSVQGWAERIAAVACRDGGCGGAHHMALIIFRVSSTSTCPPSGPTTLLWITAPYPPPLTARSDGRYVPLVG